MDFICANGKKATRLGMGTWYLGEHRETFVQEQKSLCAGFDAGITLIDTAEMYGEGAAESLIGSILGNYDREGIFVVSKVYPYNAGRKHMRKSCEASLRRMKTDYLDLYLLHWEGRIPFQETIDCMEDLKRDGLIRNWGVSNMDVPEMEEITACRNGSHCLTDQVLFHLGSRGVEYDLLPWMQERKMPMMAYCPLAQAGRLRSGILSSKTVLEVASAHSATPEQIMLAFLLSKEGVIPIPRSKKAEHTLANAKALDITLTAEDLKMLDSAYPAPTHKMPLDMQ